MFFFKPVKGGVRVPHRKHTAECESVRMPVPETVTIPLSQHIGPPCKPTVAVGDTVAVGQCIGDTDAFLSSPIHASVSGTVSAISSVTLPGGQTCDAIVIKTDGEQRLYEGLTPPTLDTREDFIAAVRASGLVGLGGAGFPTHVKLNPQNIDDVDTVVVNAAECEPYITADFRECMENPDGILEGVCAIMQHLDLKRSIIGIEANKPQAIELLTARAAALTTPEREITVKTLPTRYPQGAEKVLIAQTTGRKVPPGRLPADVGCVVINVTSVGVLARYLQTGMPLVEKRITVDGTAVETPQNVIVPLGTAIKDILAFCGGLKVPAAKLLMGGPMMGRALPDDSLPLLKQNNAILAFDEQEATLPAPSACIRCGKCVSACPMNLTPPAIATAFKRGDAAELEKRGALVCMECGCCAYSCPAHRPIVQSMKLAKDLVRRARKS